MAEALSFAKKAGPDVDKVREVLLGGLSALINLEMHGLRMIDREVVVTAHIPAVIELACRVRR